MSRELANILKVEKLTPIKGKDRIELAQVENWDIIVAYLRAYLEGNYQDIDVSITNITINRTGLAASLIQLALLKAYVDALAGNVHAATITMFAINSGDLWTYIGNKDDGEDFFILPDTQDLINAGYTWWSVTHDNKSGDAADIVIQTQTPADKIDGNDNKTSIYGDSYKIYWSGGVNFFTELNQVAAGDIQNGVNVGGEKEVFKQKSGTNLSLEH